jgi:hypothetical protein
VIANVNSTTTETIHSFFNKIKENINQLCQKQNKGVTVNLGVGTITFLPNHTFDFKSLEVNERLETSVFDADFKSSPFRKNTANRGPSYARYLASRDRGSSLKAKGGEPNDINCLSNFLKE